MKPPPRLHIIGGGFSGLMTAFYAREAGFDVRVSEKNRWGGWLGTKLTPEGLVEEAANAFLWTEELERVSQVIGVRLERPRPSAKTRYVATDVPQALSPLQFLPAGLLFLKAFLKRQHRPFPLETFSGWGQRVLGPRFTQNTLKAATRGVWGASADQLSASLLLAPLFQKKRERRRGSVAPRDGMQAWIDALVRHLQSQGVILKIEEARVTVNEDHLVLATSWKQKADLLQGLSPLAAELYRQMRAVSLTSATAHFTPAQDAITPGFGILFHPDHRWNAAGVLFNDQIFENRGPHQSETWIFDRVLNESEARERLLQDRARLGRQGSLLALRITHAVDALPLYSTAHESLLIKLKSLTPELRTKKVHLIGNELGEIGLTSLALRARELVRELKADATLTTTPLKGSL